MPQGGTLTIATASVQVGDGDAERPAGVPAGHYARLRVSDTGIGFTDETKARMFDPFFTTKGAGRGTGLGLSTVYGIVAQSGGHIFAQSEPGAGARFEVLFPAAGHSAVGRPSP
jgi:signal transduction histidine kinase